MEQRQRGDAGLRGKGRRRTAGVMDAGAQDEGRGLEYGGGGGAMEERDDRRAGGARAEARGPARGERRRGEGDARRRAGKHRRGQGRASVGRGTRRRPEQPEARARPRTPRFDVEADRWTDHCVLDRE
ncbi:hypothetical protein BS78_04G017800 [Paspalum vaginatum]|nr:hypothetical protein BS78_04G017800 [Paspalum vaginatum]